MKHRSLDIQTQSNDDSDHVNIPSTSLPLVIQLYSLGVTSFFFNELGKTFFMVFLLAFFLHFSEFIIIIIIMIINNNNLQPIVHWKAIDRNSQMLIFLWRTEDSDDHLNNIRTRVVLRMWCAKLEVAFITVSTRKTPTVVLMQCKMSRLSECTNYILRSCQPPSSPAHQQQLLRWLFII